MHARSTTIRDVHDMDAGIGYVRYTVLPAVQKLSGCVGLSLLADRSRAICVVTTAWADDAAMHAAADTVQGMRERAADVFGGPAQVKEWEVGLLHRKHPAPEGACTRVTWSTGDPADLDAAIATWRVGVLPRLDELPGFCSVSLLVDRETGESAAAVTYDSRADMDRANRQASAMRAEIAHATDALITEIAEFDLVVAHLRVPEIA
jgi:hypothetical protein